jgi:hypothetical protein
LARYRRSARTAAAAALIACCVSQRSPAQTRQPAAGEWPLVKPLFALVEQVAAGRAAPTDAAVAWQCHFLNADAGVVFVPFALRFERGLFASFPIAMYVRVVARGAPAPAPGPRDALAQYPFEDAAIVDEPADGRIVRAFTAPPGDYDVYVALAERSVSSGATARTAVVKKTVSVPRFESTLAVSSVIVADKVEIDSSRKRPDFEQQLDHPYTLWGTKVTPSMTTTFARSGKLSVIFVVYNATAADADKPDVEVRYNVHRSAGPAEVFFAAAPPEQFNAQTLAPHFSLAAGDLIVAGQQVPLMNFPDGEYRLEIVVTDRAARTSVARDVRFTVAG